MKTYQDIDAFARDIEKEVQQSVHNASRLKTESRYMTLERDFDEPENLRRIAGEIKQHTLDNLAQYLEQAEASLSANGAKVHWATDASAANDIIYQIMQERGCRSMVKSKSMVSEETHLVPYLEEKGMEAVETDLGEFIVQIDKDHPSHIVTPIIHKNRKQVARSFEREGLGDYNEDPETITRRARNHLRRKYLEADVGLSGANFVVAESGRLVISTNEGNGRFCLAAPRVHIALVGIEKLVPRDRDLAVFLNLLGRSATGQQLTVYTQMVSGPKAEGSPHGPEEMHVVFLDNGRSDILNSEFREILRCIRCGACLNICPVYRQGSGHAYRSVYPGPVGSVLSPLLAGDDFPALADLPKACSVCGACKEVCPVKIPLPELLLKLRDRAKKEKCKRSSAGTPPMGAWSILASQPMLWKSAMTMGNLMNFTPHAIFNVVPPARAWQSVRQLPEFRGGKFRSWFKEHQKESGKGGNRSTGEKSS